MNGYKNFNKFLSIFALIISLLASSYYSYLNNLYLIDEVYEGNALREYDITEKFTIIM